MLVMIAGMLAIPTYIVGPHYPVCPRGILIFLNNILNLHIYQGYTSSNGLLHDFTRNTLTLMALMILKIGTQDGWTEREDRERIIGNPSLKETRVVLG